MPDGQGQRGLVDSLIEQGTKAGVAVVVLDVSTVFLSEQKTDHARTVWLNDPVVQVKLGFGGQIKTDRDRARIIDLPQFIKWKSKVNVKVSIALTGQGQLSPDCITSAADLSDGDLYQAMMLVRLEHMRDLIHALG